jgi:hypothetical protein
MNQNRKVTILLAGFVFLALILCGVIGYINDSGRVFPSKAGVADESYTATPAAIDFVYCNSPASLCVISFGRDNADNMLVVIKNNIPGLADFHANISQAGGTPDLYPCQKVQFVSDVYYCLGKQIPDGTMITVDIYSENDGRLVASGRLPVSLEAMPVASAEVPIATRSPSVTEQSPSYPSVTEQSPSYPGVTEQAPSYP